ncbi:putative peptidoglycan lipid II flippase [Actinoplanes lutulentus]|uniref:Putative peptidoglycan lipid II flippase n=1 Tax=Actinoplanes lutulentus TaxID=1287878 RepID=A0A327YY47_9ACTN|nr:lipid II flippase MurJ [Actinoplanes lutulentus]MBB2943134.1 putative peptidoglycan lipid II flippase [Actinoplanes lutulentus]RAK25571.1 putative peptidoglycan lipid II flippase [Actinoplanes lutulentus]
MTDTAKTAAKIAGAAALITVLTVVARLAGFGRTLVFFYTVGEGGDGGLADIYFAANTVPNIVFELVAGGALASLVVPLVAKAAAEGDRQRVGAVTSALLTWMLALTVPLAVLVALAAGPITGLLQGVDPAHQEVAARMLRIFAPQLPLYGIGIVLAGVLQAHHRFAWPVIAPLLSSVTVMSAYLAYAGIDGARTGFAGLSTAGELTLSIGTTLGVVVLTLCLFVPLARLRLRLRPSLRFPGDEGQQAVRLGWAGAVTVGAQQIVVALVVTLGAAQLARYNGAQTVFLLPWAVLAVPLATAVYPRLSDAAARGDEDAYASALSGTAKSIILLAGLGAAALAGLAVPAAFLMNAPGAVPGIIGFAPGLLGYAMFALLSRALYARGASRAAAAASGIGWLCAGIVVVAVTASAGGRAELLGLGLANAAGMTVTGMLLVRAVRRHAGPAALAGFGRAGAAAVVAALAAGVAGWATVTGLERAFWPTPGVPAALAEGMLGGVAVVVVFAVVAYALDRRDMQPLVARLRK